MFPLALLNASSPPVDPNLVLLMHFDNNFDDSSGNNYSLSGNAVISSAQSKFGGSSAFFYVSESVSSSVDAIPPFAESDFTVEFWMYYTREENIFDAATENLVGFLPSSLPSERLMIRLDSSIGGTLQVEMVGGSTTSGFITTSITKTNLRGRWAHIAFVRQGTSFKLYVDGTLAGSVTYSASFAIHSTLTIGKLPGGTNYYRGYIDELRISDSAVYTANFTPPTSPF